MKSQYFKKKPSHFTLCRFWPYMREWIQLWQTCTEALRPKNSNALKQYVQITEYFNKNAGIADKQLPFIEIDI